MPGQQPTLTLLTLDTTSVLGSVYNFSHSQNDELWVADIDECTQDGSDVCPDTNDNCVNSNGSFECHCNQGYERVTPNSNCTGNQLISYGWMLPLQVATFMALAL